MGLIISLNSEFTHACNGAYTVVWMLSRMIGDIGGGGGGSVAVSWMWMVMHRYRFSA